MVVCILGLRYDRAPVKEQRDFVAQGIIRAICDRVEGLELRGLQADWANLENLFQICLIKACQATSGAYNAPPL